MDKSQEEHALDNIHDIAVWVLAKTEDTESRAALRDIVAIARHKKPEPLHLDMEKYRPKAD